ncbi:MAG: phosphoadenylyl-sulfate reductase [Bacteroidota bacterium]
MIEISDQSIYKDLHPIERLEKLFKEFSSDEILVTSSFGSSSGILLKLVNDVAPGHPIHFLDTGYHFKETLSYKELLTSHLGLNVIDVIPEKEEHAITSQFQIWRHNTEYCCFVNKVKPLNPLKEQHQVWISGIMSHQNANRANKQIFEKSRSILKFYPLLDLSKEEAALFNEIYEIPSHPLVAEGYQSIGCAQCTKKGEKREGRWAGETKTECGLHI